MTRRFRYNGDSKDGLHIYDRALRENLLLEKGKVFETENPQVAQTLSELPDVEEVKQAEAAGEKPRPRKLNGES